MTGGEATSRRLPLAAAPDSAALARRFVAAGLRDWSLDALTVEATTIVSELVTNAVLHAGVDIECGLQQLPDGVRIEVHDGVAGELTLPTSAPSPRWSLLDPVDDLEAVEALLLVEATTGRGLQVVSELAADWGMETRPDGKVVWALVCLEAPEGSVSPHIDVPVRARPSAAPAGPAPQAEVGRPIRFVAVPVRLALQSDLQLNALVREFQVMGGPKDRGGRPRELVTAARSILEHYSQPRSAGRRAARDAVSRGDRLVDLTLIVPDGAAAALRRLLGLLHEVDGFCRDGQLLALAAPPELQHFRLWYLEEIERQFAGEPPAACPFPVEPFADTSASSAVELEPAAVEELSRLSSVLRDAADPEAIARLVLAEAVRVLGADRASVCLVAADRTNVDIIESIGYAGPVADHWSRFPLAADLPASETIRTGTSIVLRTVSERNTRYPVFASTPALEDPSFVCVPLGDRAPPPGALVLNFARSRDFRVHDLRLVEAFGAVAADAFARVAARAARVHRERLGRLRDVLLTGRPVDTVTDLLPEVAVRLSGEVFDYCICFVVQDDEPVLLAAEHRDPVRAALIHRLHTEWPPRPGEGTIGRCLSTGEVVVQQVVPPEILPRIAESTEHLNVLRQLDINSTAAAPISADDGSVLGALVVANQAGRYITDHEVDFLRTLAEGVSRRLARSS